MMLPISLLSLNNIDSEKEKKKEKVEYVYSVLEQLKILCHIYSALIEAVETSLNQRPLGFATSDIQYPVIL